MNWIKMSDRKPTEADMPLWAAYADGRIHVWLSSVPENCTHWMHITNPAPPPKEKTQKELDEEAFNVCWETFPVKIRDFGNAQRTAFMAALKWEREQVGAMLNKLCLVVINEDRTTWENLRKRCGL